MGTLSARQNQRKLIQGIFLAFADNFTIDGQSHRYKSLIIFFGFLFDT